MSKEGFSFASITPLKNGESIRLDIAGTPDYDTVKCTQRLLNLIKNGAYVKGEMTKENEKYYRISLLFRSKKA